MASTLPDGFSLEHPPPDRSGRISGFIRDWDLAVSGISDFTHEDLRHLMRHPGFDPARDWWIVTEGDEIVGAGMMWAVAPLVHYSTFSVVRIDRQGLGLGAFMLGLCERRAGELADESPAGEVLIRTHVDRLDPGGKALVEAAGYVYVRSSYTMIGPLPTGITVPPPVPGLTIRTSSLDEGPLIHRLIEDTFSEHFGFRPVTYEEWAEGTLKRADADPDLWFIAEVDGEEAGLCLASVEGEQGWIADLGVRKDFRKRGIGEALLHHAFGALVEKGCTRVGLGVDAGNETGAVALYEKVGLRNERTYDSFDKTFRARTS